ATSWPGRGREPAVAKIDMSSSSTSRTRQLRAAYPWAGPTCDLAGGDSPISCRTTLSNGTAPNSTTPVCTWASPPAGFIFSRWPLPADSGIRVRGSADYLEECRGRRHFAILVALVMEGESDTNPVAGAAGGLAVHPERAGFPSSQEHDVPG